MIAAEWKATENLIIERQICTKKHLSSRTYRNTPAIRISHKRISVTQKAN